MNPQIGFQERAEEFEKMRVALSAHAEAEQAALYSRLKEEDPTRETARRAARQHHTIGALLQELRSAPIQTEAWMEKFRLLQIAVDDHVAEEEGEMFPLAHRQLAPDEPERLRGVYEERRDRFKSHDRPRGLRRETTLAV